MKKALHSVVGGGRRLLAATRQGIQTRLRELTAKRQLGTPASGSEVQASRNKPNGFRDLPRRSQAFLVAGLVLAVVPLVAVGISSIVGVFSEGSGIPAVVKVSCAASLPASVQDGACRVSILPSGSGKYYLAAEDTATSMLVVDLEIPDGGERPRRLMVRQGVDGAEAELRVLLGEPGRGLVLTAQTELPAAAEQSPTRLIIPLEPSDQVNRVQLVLTKGVGPLLQLNEFGLYSTTEGPLDDRRVFLRGLGSDQWQLVVIAVIWAAICAGVVLVFLIGARGAKFFPVFVLTVAFAVTTFALWRSYDPERAVEDLQTFAARIADSPGGSNLNYGQYMALSFFEGEGLYHYWNRMPGYGLFVVLAAVTTGATGDVLQMTLSTMLWQLITFWASIAFFSWAVSRIVWPPLGVLLSIVLCLAPNQLSYTQVDSLMPAVTFLLFGAIALFLWRKKRGRVPLPYHLAIHGSFALWFLMRPDILPAWALASIALHYRSWRHLLIPLVLASAIGCGWGLHKYVRTGEFDPTTTSFGSGLMVGLWEAPHRFQWTVSDASYAEFVADHGLSYSSKEASSFAVREVVRFWLTLPGYTASLLWHESMNFVFRQSWPGSLRLPGFEVRWLRGTELLLMLAVVVLSFVYRTKVLQTILFGSVFLFNTPIFFLVYSSGGRFYFPASASLFIAASVLIFDKELARRIWSSPFPASVVLALMLLAAFWGQSLDTFLLSWDEFRYWVPVFDPAESSLYRVNSP